MMNRQERLCNVFMEDMRNQLYTLGNEVKIEGMGNPLKMTQDKRQFGDDRGKESYQDMVTR